MAYQSFDENFEGFLSCFLCLFILIFIPDILICKLMYDFYNVDHYVRIFVCQ